MPDDFLNTIVLPALYSVLAAVIPIVAGFLIDAIRKWSEKQKAVWMRAVLQEATDAAERAVQMVEQTYAREARDEKGHLAPNRAEEAFHSALVAARTQLGHDGLDALGRLLGDGSKVDPVLGSFIEAAVGKRKAPTVVIRPSSDEFLTGG